MKTNVMLLTALLAGACTKTIVLKETTPVAITAQRQAQAPEPEPEPPRVEVKQDRIEVNDTIQFDFNKATIRSDSFGLLDEIAKVIGELEPASDGS
jgi:OOP family OmpA-OmpF porin